ncbi:MAG: hypothetical protein OXN94_02125 [Chloroflexota bacterium]|nr:hypothetical protein [Chloroflexota bacterium]
MPELWKRLLPDWAHPDHPILQYELAQRRLGGSRWKSALQLFLLGLLLGGGGYLYARVTSIDAGVENLADFLWRCLYFPSLLIQTATVLAGLAFGMGSVAADRSRQTWDSLRVTEFGAGMTLRARWAGILYRLRAPIIALLLTRLLLAFGMTVNLTAFGGGYLRVLSSSILDISPDLWIALPMVVLLMTVQTLLPLVTVGAAGAFGILISVAVKQGLFAITIQLVLSFTIVAAVVGGLFAVTSALGGGLTASDELLFLLFLGYSGFADGGMLLTNLGSLGAVGKLLPQGAYLSIGLPLILALEAFSIDGCLGLAIRLSEQGE